MKLVVVSAAPLISSPNGWKAYGPYVKEMELWAKYCGEIQFCCPVWKSDRGLLVSEIPFETEPPVVLKEFDVKSFVQALKSIFAVWINLTLIIKAMKSANHIHLRCPGNIGLLACFVQIAFPNKPKTAKYAGNWDPKSKQPVSYRIQKWILSNTFLTKNMQVLVYGEWEGSTKNIKSFFTATYHEADKKEIQIKNLSKTIEFLFVGTLSAGKQPLYAVQLIHELKKKGFNVKLNLYGEGKEREKLENYIEKNTLQEMVFLKGNQNAVTIQEAYENSNFLILPSQSEGWPKVVAEAMFWGCVPISSPVSCVPNMLDYGDRGVILKMNLENDVKQVALVLDNESKYQAMTVAGMEWSRKYTLDYFEDEIKKMLVN